MIHSLIMSETCTEVNLLILFSSISEKLTHNKACDILLKFFLFEHLQVCQTENRAVVLLLPLLVTPNRGTRCVADVGEPNRTVPHVEVLSVCENQNNGRETGNEALL